MMSTTVKRVRLGDVATYVNGYAFKPTEWSDRGKLIIRIQDLTGNSYQMNRFSGIVPTKYDVVKGDVLISWSASLGVYVWDKEDALLNQHIFKVVFDKMDVDKRYFFHQVGLRLRNAASEAHGCTMKHLTKPIFDALPFSLPSIVEQKRIAAVLDKIGEMKRNAEARLQKLDLLVKARFNEMFGDGATNPKGWVIGTLSDVAKYWNGLTYKPENISDNGTIVLRSSNIQSGALSFHDVVRVSVNAKEKNCVRRGDILMCSRNGSAALVGKTAIIPQLNEMMYFGAFMLVVRCEQPEYLNTFFGSKAFREQISCGKTTTVNQITCSMMDKVRLPLPPLALQREFAAFVEKVEALKATIKKELTQVDLLYRSKLQEYFG